MPENKKLQGLVLKSRPEGLVLKSRPEGLVLKSRPEGLVLKSRPEGFLPKYRVLDLADEKGAYCGKLLADLGAEVIKIEPPCGDKTRLRGPFFKHDGPP